MSKHDLHSRLMTLDAHLDTPVHFGRPGWDFGARHAHATEIAQVDLGRMDEALSGGFFVIYTPQGPLTPDGYAAALAHARARTDAIDAALALHPDRIGAAATAAEAEQLHAQGRRIALRSMENSYPVGEDLSLLAEFRRRGVRLAGPVHARSNQLADSATDAPLWDGLSLLGCEWLVAANRLGIVPDASHASDAAFDQMLALSAAPILLSHSAPRAAYDTPRNIDDPRLRALAAAGGVVCVAPIYLSAMSHTVAWRTLFDRLAAIGELDPERQAALTTDWRAHERTHPMWDADLDSYVAALLHVIDVIGIEAVGFGSDFDGGGGLPGLEDVTALPAITTRLQRAGLGEADLAKLWSGNILRVLRAAEDVALGVAAGGDGRDACDAATTQSPIPERIQ